MSVLAQLEHDLAKLPDMIRHSTLAEGARSLASAMDSSESLRDLASALKELRATMADLKVMADQVPKESDPIDQLTDTAPGKSGATVSYLPRRSG